MPGSRTPSWLRQIPVVSAVFYGLGLLIMGLNSGTYNEPGGYLIGAFGILIGAFFHYRDWKRRRAFAEKYPPRRAPGQGGF